jgi:hypothetical protein
VFPVQEKNPKFNKLIAEQQSAVITYVSSQHHASQRPCYWSRWLHVSELSRLIPPLLTVKSGGSIIADILSRTDEMLKGINIFAAARTQDQVDKISKLERVHAFLLDLQDKPAVEYAIAKYESELFVCL